MINRGGKMRFLSLFIILLFILTVSACKEEEESTVASGNSEEVSEEENLPVKSWTHPNDLSDNISPDGQNADYPQVAIDSSGDSIIVWEQYSQTFFSEYRSGSWTHPSDLSDYISPTAAGSDRPQVAMDNSGDAIIVWYGVDYYTRIFKSEYRSGGWIHPSSQSDHISPYHYASNPQVVMDSNGNTVIVWNQNDGNNLQTCKSEYRSGSWTHPSSLSDNISPNGQNTGNPKVAMDDNNNAIIIRSQNDGSYNQIFKSEYRSGSWTHPSSLNDNISPDGQHTSELQIAMDNNGNAIIAWSQIDGSNYQLFKSEYSSGSWTHPSGLSDNISPDGQPVNGIQIAMDNNGNAVIVWRQSDGFYNQIFMSEYRNGSWDHPSSLTDNISPDGQSAGQPQVAMDNNGNTIIVWVQSDGSHNQIFISEYRSGSWTHPSSLNDNISSDGQHAGNPEVAMNNNSNAIIVWRQSDGFNNQIFISEFG